ncbi:hypothetical protein FQZ97_504050 [compost metagenome]
MARAEVEDEGRRAVHRLGTLHPAAAGHGFDAVVAGAGLAAHHHRGAVGQVEAALQAPRGAAFDHLRKRHAQCPGDFRGHHLAAAAGFRAEDGLVGGVRGEMQAVDAQRRQAHAIVEDDAHQLGQGRRPVAGAAQRGGERRHQVVERETELFPLLVQVEEGFHFQHDADALVAGVLVPRLVQPAVDLLALGGAGGHGVGEGGLRLLLQVAEQPEFQRVHAGDVALVVEVVGARTVALVEIGHALLGDLFTHVLALFQAGLDEFAEGREVRLRLQVAVDRGQPHRPGAQAVEEGFQALFGVLAAVFLPEAPQVDLAFLVDEAVEVFLAARILVVGQHRYPAAGVAVDLVADQVTQQTHEGQVDRFAQGVLDGRNAAVVLLAEVAEGVDAAAGEEALVRARRVLALQRRLEHGLQAAVLRRHEVLDGPFADEVQRHDLDGLQLGGRQVRIFAMQRGDGLQVAGQHPQLGGGAQFQLAAFVDVERLVGVVGLHPHAVAAGGAFEQGEAVAHVPGLVLGQQAFAEQADFLGEGRVGEPLQVGGDLVLQVLLQGGGEGQVEAVEVVQRHAEHPGQAGARQGHALVRLQRLHGRLVLRVAETQLGFEGGIAQRRADDVGLGQQAQVAVGHAGELGASARQVIGRAAVGDHQRYHLAQRLALFFQPGAGGGRGAEQLVDALIVGVVPDPQAVGQAADFAVAGLGGQRHRVEVGEDDVLPRLDVLRAIHVAAHAGRGHLPQLVGDRVGPSVGRVAVLLDLRRQGAAARGMAVETDHLANVGDGRLGEAAPVDGRVVVGGAVVQQVAVLDEQQALHDQRGDAVEAGVELLRIAEVVDRQAPAVVDVHAGLGFFRIGREEAVAAVLHERLGEAHLAQGDEITLVQALQEGRQLLVAQTAVVGPLLRIDHLAGRPLGELPGQAAGVVRQLAGLQLRGARLVQQGRPDGRQQRQEEKEQDEETMVVNARLFRSEFRLRAARLPCRVLRTGLRRPVHLLLPAHARESLSKWTAPTWNGTLPVP